MLSLLLPWLRIDATTALPLMTTSLMVSAAILGWIAGHVRPIPPPTPVELDAVHRLIDRTRLDLEESLRQGQPDPTALAKLQSLQSLLPEGDLRRPSARSEVPGRERRRHPQS
jgi:hypothetical protein